MHKKSQLTAGLFALLSAAVILGGYLFIGPKLDTIVNGQTIISEAEYAAQAQENRIKNMMEMQGGEEAILEQLVELSQRIPVTGGQTQVMWLLDGLIQSSGVNVSRLEIAGTTQAVAAPLVRRNISMEVSGSPEQIREFLRAMRTDSQIFIVDTLSYQAGGSTSLSLTGGAISRDEDVTP